MTPIDLVLQRLEGHRLRASGPDRWRACGVCHGGTNPSALSIGVGDGGQVLLVCRVGCEVATIVDALGLEMRDLFPSDGGGGRSERPVSIRASAPANGGRETLSEWGMETWGMGLSPGAADPYFEARGCRLPPARGHLRVLLEHRHPSGYVGSCLVGLVTDVITAAPISLALTWYQADGTKAAVDGPRRYLGGHRKAGGCIRLWPDDEVTHCLGIGEGIETCLSLAHAVRPVWACLDAGNLGSFPVLPGIEALTISADNDDAGRKAADRCAQRWLDAGREVRVVMPPTVGTDLNDVARAA